MDSGQWEKLFSLFSDDIFYERPGHQPIIGIDNFKHFFLHVRTIKDSKHTLMSIISEGNSVAVHGRFEGYMKDGSQAEFGFADFFEFSQGKINNRYSYTTVGKV